MCEHRSSNCLHCRLSPELYDVSLLQDTQGVRGPSRMCRYGSSSLALPTAIPPESDPFLIAISSVHTRPNWDNKTYLVLASLLCVNKHRKRIRVFRNSASLTIELAYIRLRPKRGCYKGVYRTIFKLVFWFFFCYFDVKLHPFATHVGGGRDTLVCRF